MERESIDERGGVSERCLCSASRMGEKYEPHLHTNISNFS